MVQDPVTSGAIYLADVEASKRFALGQRSIKDKSNWNELISPGIYEKINRRYKPGKRKAHCYGWVHTADVKWLRRDGMSFPLPSVGPTWGRDAGIYFMDKVVSVRPDMFGITKEQIRGLLEKGTPVKHTSVVWRLVPPPPNAEAVLRTGCAFDPVVKGSWFDLSSIDMSFVCSTHCPISRTHPPLPSCAVCRVTMARLSDRRLGRLQVVRRSLPE